MLKISQYGQRVVFCLLIILISFNSNAQLSQNSKNQKESTSVRSSQPHVQGKINIPPEKHQEAIELQKLLKSLYNKDGSFKKDAPKILLKEGMLEEIVKKNQELLKDVPDDEILTALKEKFKIRGHGKLVDKYPKFFSFVVKLLKHDTALVDLVKDVRDFRNLKLYLLSLVITFVLKLLFSHEMSKRQVKFVYRFPIWLGSTITFLLLNFLCIYLIYRKSLDPIIRIARHHF